MAKSSIQSLFKQALKKHLEGHLSQAEQLCEEVLKHQPHHSDSLHLLGMIKTQEGQFEKATDYLEKALSLKPESAIIHNHLANALSKLNRGNEAIQHYTKALHLTPDYFDAHYNLGLFFLKQNSLENAAQAFRQALKLDPHYFPAYLHLGNILLQQNNVDEAIAIYQKIVQHYPHHIDSLNNLGAAHMKKNQSLEAIQCFSTVLRIDEGNAIARNNLAATLIQQERYPDAIWHYQKLLDLLPKDSEAHYNLGVSLIATGELSEATHHFKMALEIKPDHLDARINLGTALLKIDRKEEALLQFEEALRIKPDNPAVRYLMGALSGKEMPQAAPSEYVEHLFNDYANRFEHHVVDELDYQTPRLLRKLLEETPDYIKKPLKILDLGCGTGLSGAAFRDSASYLAGVDLSSKMIDIARSKSIYEELHVEDMLNFLVKTPTAWDLIVAADVFVYTGDLRRIFEASCAALKPQGLLLFSTEINPHTETYLLQLTARYAHSKKYVTSLAQEIGFSVNGFQEVTLRKQGNQPLKGYLFLIQKDFSEKILTVRPEEAALRDGRYAASSGRTVCIGCA